MTEHHYHSLVRQFYALFHTPDEPLFNTVVNPDYRTGRGMPTSHFTGKPEFEGPTALRQEIERFREALNNIEFKIDDIVLDEDKAFVQWTASADHPSEKFTDRGGSERPLRLGARGIGRVKIKSNSILRNEMFWADEGRGEFLQVLNNED